MMVLPIGDSSKFYFSFSKSLKLNLNISCMNSAFKLEETFWHHSEIGELDSNLNSATCLLCELGQVKMHFHHWQVKNVPALVAFHG